MKYRGLFASLILMLVAFVPLNANPVIKAVVNAIEYEEGDIIKVLVTLDDIENYHGIYFDLDYDDSICTFTGIREGSLIKRTPLDNRLSYAYSDSTLNSTLSPHVIVSYTLQGENTEVSENGVLLELQFLVTAGGAADNCRFSFNDCQVIDKTDNPLEDVTWLDSEFFGIRESDPLEFIMIKEPYDNQVFYDDQFEASLICSEGEFIVRFSSDRHPGVSMDYPVSDGRLISVPLDELPLQEGFNIMKAELIKEKDDGSLVALQVYDEVKVFRADNSRFVKILSPADHSLLNTDMVDVKVSSSFPYVEVNGLIATNTGEYSGDNKVFHARVWLKRGFNTITAVAVDDTGSERIKYTDDIQVYYQKDDSIFRFVQPARDEVFKPSSYTNLVIKGEIDSPYKSVDDLDGNGPVENTVTLRVFYIPKNTLLSSFYLVKDQLAAISENDYSYTDTRSKYMFFNDFPISLDNLEDGELIIYAYKNKNGEAYDDLITRVVHIDNQRLWINLVQPNVFATDHLDNQLRIMDYNENKFFDPDGDVEISLSGEIQLAAGDNVCSNAGIGQVDHMITQPNGTLLAISNTSNGLLKILRKQANETAWSTLLTRPGMHGYELCYTDLGILIGVSNLYTTTNSGLYLMSGTEIVNIQLPEDISDVQFIKRIGNRIYLYGNNYPYLYHFDLYTIEESEGSLVVPVLNRDLLSNNVDLKQFELSTNTEFALLRKEGEIDNIFLYEKTSQGYLNVTAPLDGLRAPISGKSFVLGEYSSGDYHTVAVVTSATTLEVIMINRYTGKIIRNTVSLEDLDLPGDAVLTGLGYQEDNFFLFYRTASGYYLQKGKLFFKRLLPDPYDPLSEYQAASGGIDITYTCQELFVPADNQIFLGVGSHLVPGAEEDAVYSINKQLVSQGSCDFNYVNDDIDGILGFEFEVNPRWVELEDTISFGFAVKEKSAAMTSPEDTGLFFLETVDLKWLVDRIRADEAGLYSTDYFEITNKFDANSGNYILHVEFKDLQENKYLQFHFDMASKGAVSPELVGLKVFKKVKAKIAAVPGEEVVLPIHGYVYDRTVREVVIQHNTIPLGWDGSFYFDYELKTQKNEIPVEISCTNAIGEKAVIQFNVEIVESYNNVWGVRYRHEAPDAYLDLTPDPLMEDFFINTEYETMQLSGKYFGLKGCVVGYELSGYNPGTDSYELLERGLFDVEEDNTLKDELGFVLGPEYTAGTFTDQEIGLFPGEQRLAVYCENPGGKRSDFGCWRISFADEVIPSSQDTLPQLRDIQLLPSPDNKSLLVSAGFTGQPDCVIGYKLFSADGEDLLESGLLNKEIRSSLLPDVAGVVLPATIELPAGARKLLLFCHNQNGLMREYHYDLQLMFPGIIYNIPDDQQAILFDLDDEIEKTVNGIRITRQKILNAYESEGPDYAFTREYEIQGQINALFVFNDLLVKDITPTGTSESTLLFPNGEREMVIPVEAGNRFSFTFTVTLADNVLDEKFYLAAIPSMPFKNGLKRGVELIVKKDFEDTDYRMDFTLSRPDNWAASDVDAGLIPLRFRFNREDVPLDKYFTAEFTLNYIHHFRGYVDLIDDDVYCLRDEVSDEILKFALDQLRINSLNRLQWHLEYNDKLENSVFVVSSSASGKVGMQDFVFTYTKETETLPTEVSFTEDFTDVYYNTDTTPLPGLNLSRDKLTLCSLLMNGKKLNVPWNTAGNPQTYTGSLYVLGKELIDEGKNSFIIEYKEPGKNLVRLNRTFLFDSQVPRVVIETFDIEKEYAHPDYLKLYNLSACVKEANFQQAFLYFDNNIINAEPEIEIKGNSEYLIHWSDLADYAITPSATRVVKVEVRDHAGRSAFSAELTGLEDILRPSESFVAEDYFEMPLYDTDNQSVYVDNEDGYKGRPFTRHTKFAPGRFLPKLDIREELQSQGLILITNTTDNEPYETALSCGEGQGKFMVIRIPKDPAHSLYDIEAIRNKINFNLSGYKFNAESEKVSFKSQPLALEENKDCIYVEGFNFLYYIVLIYQDSTTPLSEQSAGLKGRFYGLMANLIQQVQDQESFGEARLTLAFDSNWSAGLHKDIYVTGGDANVFKDIIMYDSNYEDPEHYRVDVSDLIQEKELQMIKNTRGREQQLTPPDMLDDIAFGNAVDLYNNLAIIGAPKDLNSAGEAAGAAYLYRKGLNGDWDLSSQVKLESGEGEAGDRFGFSVAVTGNTALVGAPYHKVEGVPTGAVYLFTKNEVGEWEESMCLNGANSEAGDMFGYSVALYGDYALIGAPLDSINGIVNGAVYLYKKQEDGMWSQLTKLLPSDTTAPSHLGVSLAMTGKYVLAGDNWDDSANTNPGAVYVFSENESGIWLQREVVTVPQTGNNGFGLALSVCGGTGVVGAPLDDTGAPDAGTVYFLEQDENGNWQVGGGVQSMETAAGDYFGRDVSIAGDYAVVGAPMKSGKRGTVYVFCNDGSNWIEKNQFYLQDAAAGDFFGKAVVIKGDSILAGGPYNYLDVNEVSGVSLTPELDKPGSVFFYRKSSNSEKWGEQDYQKLMTADGQSYDLFGQAVAVSGDYVFVGAYGDDDQGSDSGSVSIYKKNPVGKWNLNQKILPADARGDDLFGYSMSVSGDVAIFGSPSDDTANGNNAGSAVIYQCDADGLWQEVIKLIPDDGSAGDRFGQSVAIYGDYAIVGAPYFDTHNDFPNAGAVYVYERNSLGMWVRVTRITPSDGMPNDYFGQSVSLYNGLLVIGSPGVDEYAADMGAAYVYIRDGAGLWGFNQKLDPFDGLASDQFGTSVAVSGNFVIVGSPGYDAGTFDNGKAYAFRQTTGGIWICVDQLSGDESIDGKLFGCCISMLGNQAIIGAYDSIDLTNALSTAYIFEREASDIWERITRVIIGSGESGYDITPSVGISGEDFVVGVPYEQNRTGAAYVHSLTELLAFNDDSNDNYQDIFTFNYEPADDPFVDSVDLMPEELTDYLIFKIRKNTAEPVIAGLDDIEGEIRFVFTASGFDYVENRKRDYQKEFTLTESLHYYYESRDQDLYFIINRTGIDALKMMFQQEMQENALFNEIGSVKVYDRGSLRVLFSGALQDYSGIRLFTAVHGRDEIDSQRVADFAHDFYDLGSLDYQSDDYLGLHPALRYDFSERSLTHPNNIAADPDIPGMTFNFWLRIEDEGQSDKESVYADTPRRVFSLVSPGGEEILHLQYKYNMMELYKDEIPLTLDPDTCYYGPIFTEPLKKDDWFLISLIFEKASRSMYCAIDGKVIKAVNLGGEVLDDIMSAGAVYYFGPGDSEQYNSGFYSIASASYIYEILSELQLRRLFQYYERNPQRVLEYMFRGMGGVLDSDPFSTQDQDGDLSVFGGNDYYAYGQNADYSQSSEDGAFKASGIHRNFLTLRDGAGGKCMVFEGNNVNYYYYNLDVVTGVPLNQPDPFGAGSGFRLEPGNKTGRFYFGNKQSNYGLGQDRWYSLSGFVDQLEEDSRAELVLVINGEAQSMTLTEGPFHFVYDNYAQLIPADVKLYIETDGTITLRNDMVFNMGNFVIDDDLQQTSGSTYFAFDLSGTLHLRFKPFMVNRNGFVDYPVDLAGKSAFREMTIFDSEFIKIGVKKHDASGENYYYLALKSNTDGFVEGDNFIWTGKRVKAGWQHLHVSYDLQRGVCYFYIDGELAAAKENLVIMPFGSIMGEEASNRDNVWLGANKEKTSFAEGYLDQLYLSKYFEDPKYTDLQPVSIAYNPETLQVELGAAAVSADRVEEASVLNILECLDDGSSSVSRGFPINLVNFPGGRYRLRSSMRINGHAFENNMTFNITEKPRFDLVFFTPLIFADESKNLDFRFRYDHAYRLENQNLVYAGVCVQAEYDGLGSPRRVYLVQDFINQDKTNWKAGSFNGESIIWKDAQRNELGEISLSLPSVKSTTDIGCHLEYFYFTDAFSEPVIDTSEYELTIPIARLEEPQYVADSNELVYKVQVPLNGDAVSTEGGFTDNIEIDYEIIDPEIGLVRTGSTVLQYSAAMEKWIIELFYDDVLPDYGEYFCNLYLKYNDVRYVERKNIPLEWQKLEQSKITAESYLEVQDFSLLFMDKEQNMVNLYLSYEGKNIASWLDEQWEADMLEYTLYVKQGNQIFGDIYSGVLSTQGGIKIFNGIPVPKEESSVKITFKAVSAIDNNIQYLRTREIELLNTVDAPEVLLTNSVDSLITFNNVYFSWKGYYEGEFNQEIAYTYNLDGSGWITPNNAWRSVRFFELTEGYHVFQVKAQYNGLESAVRSVTFFVDVKKPQFNEDKIEVEKVYDASGVFYAVNLRGETGAIEDISLREVYVNGESILLGEEGSFEATELPILIDGTNNFTITARDKVGNYSDLVIPVENPVTTVVFPTAGKNVRFSPMTIVGKINSEIETGLDIYLRDPYCTVDDAGDYSGWKKAKINTDRTFFVENVFVNPGSMDKEITTDLIMRCVFSSQKTFEKVISVKANEIIMPIEMNLNTHAAEGERGDTYVEIDCFANVPNVSSWSVDFTGDGIYDVIDLVDNPDSPGAKSHFWSHKYCSMGKVNPRVRVITTDGNFFSVSDALIIHERIRQASHKLIDAPISLDKVRMPDNSERVFVLQQKDTGASVVVYEVGRNEAYISNKLFDINLGALGISHPVVLRLLNQDHLFVAANTTYGAVLYELVANEFGNYTISQEIPFTSPVREMTLDATSLYLSFMDKNYVAFFDIKEDKLDSESMRFEIPAVHNSLALDRNVGLDLDPLGLLVADYYNQRLIRFSKALNVIEQIGSFGIGEKEFLKPAIVKSFENRVFLYDESRKDIQVFDSRLNPVCVLQYNIARGDYNYLEPEFFENIVDMEIIAREESNGLYYYALLLSASSNKLAMLRLPHWEELRAKVRNNKVVFIKDGEVYTAKPDGSDLGKVLSSDSLPRIEGKIAYPALAPDGMSLLFTSRMRLYNGESYGYIDDENIHAYDNLYLVNLESGKISRLDLGLLNNYELERPVFNYNGNKIIFSAKPTAGNWQIFIYDIAEKTISKLFDSDENTRFPYYSPDDRFVVFTTDYDGDEEIAVIDVKNPHIRYYITDNECRDSFPVWSRTYPLELVNPNAIDPELEKVTSKIAFVSERGYHKGLYTSYMKHLSEDEIQVFDIREKQIQNQDPDKAAVKVSPAGLEGDYPCFTGDGRSLLFEYFDGERDSIKKFDFVGLDFDSDEEPGDINQAELMKEDPRFVFEDIELMRGAIRPAGMKNTITNFSAELQNGNELILNWNRYTTKDIFYTIQYNSKSDNPEQGEKKIFGRTESTITGLTLGVNYFVRVCIIENDEEVATSQWLEVKMPKVVSKPSYEIDPDNPYLVKFTAWQPEFVTGWDFDWIVDNTTIQMDNCNEFYYEFATSGMKTVLLKVSDKTASDLSEPMKINIISDIEPVIEYVLADDSSYIELNAENSRGSKIDLNSVVWTISGPDRDPIAYDKSQGIVQLNGFTRKINVNLALRRLPVNNQAATDTKSKNLTIDLDFKALKPVITYEANPLNDQLIKFSGEYSLGNIDWYRAKWSIYADNQLLFQTESCSSFEYQFPDTNNDSLYSVVLSVPRKNDGLTETVSKIVCIEAEPLEPVIDYELLTMKKAGQIVGYKLLLDATSSLGNSIEFGATRWSVPMPNSAEGQVVQIGPTAIYNLLDIEEGIVIEVALTLFRKNGEAKTVTELVNIRAGEFPKMRLIVNQNVQETERGRVVSLDVLQSTGPNIIWDKTQWLVDDNYTKQGAVVRVDIPAGDEDRSLPFTCTLFRDGREPEVYYGSIEVLKNKIKPVIATARLSSQENNYYELDVLQSEGMNIAWERTEWYIYDGNESVTKLYGSKVTHAFAVTEAKMGYQVMVAMYHKDGSYPFIGYKNIDVEGNEIVPVIHWDVAEDDPNAYVFSCHNSTGANIEWTQTKWTFLDTAESQYGTTVTHKFPVDSVAHTYTVALTLFRSTANGQIETKTTTKQIKIGSDKIVPVVTAKVYDDYLVLSAEDSEGRGLLLDRSVWLFPGDGDSYSYSSHIQGGVIARGNLNIAASQYLKTNLSLYTQSQAGTEFSFGTSVMGSGVLTHIGSNNGCFFKTGVNSEMDMGTSLQTSESAGVDVVDYSGYTDDNESFSSSNMHTGALCRRNVAGKSDIVVTLYVYRVESDGKMTGNSVTVKVELEKARAQAGSGGVKYD